MNIYYKILEFREEDRTITVRYYTDILTEKDLSISEDKREDGSPVRCKSDVSLTIPIPEPTYVGLHKYILKNAPIHAFKSMETVIEGKQDISLENTYRLIGRTFVKSEEDAIKLINTPKPEDGKPLYTEEEIEILFKPL